jgi:very-short-patch-repair endonuclease
MPALSVLAGPVGLGVQAWRRWCAVNGRPVVRLTDADRETAIVHWTAALAAGRDLTDDAFGFLASRTGRPLPELRAALAAKTVHDLDLFFETTAPDDGRVGAAAVCRWLLTRRAAGEPVHPDDLARRLDPVLAGRDGPWARTIAALASLAPEGSLPAVLLAPDAPPTDPVAWIDVAARLLTALVAAAPQLPAALAAERADLHHFLQTARESHGKAMVREGMITTAELDEAAVRDRLRRMGAPVDALAGPVRRLATDGATAELVDEFGRLALRPPEAEEDDARSAHERFLFDRLESLVETAGLFELNGNLDFKFGRKEAEVDFLCRDLRLAVELDGWHHFQDADHYRRDRRKEWELQRRGFVVLRFLAEDVVPRLEEILDTIQSSVAWRRGRTGRSEEQSC